MKKAIEVKNLRVQLSGNLIIDHANLEIEKGKLYFIIGGNGSGKTTLLKTILGLTELEEGEIKLFGTKWTTDEVAKHFGYVSQYSHIDRSFPITVEELIQLECESKKECNVKRHKHLEYLSSEHLLDRQISDLSGGEFQRVLIARSLVTNPDIIVMDEPINNLDIETQTDLFKLINELAKDESKTILVITHDHHLIKPRDNVVLVQDRKVYQGKGAEIIEQYIHRETHGLENGHDE